MLEPKETANRNATVLALQFFNYNHSENWNFTWCFQELASGSSSTRGWNRCTPISCAVSSMQLRILRTWKLSSGSPVRGWSWTRSIIDQAKPKVYFQYCPGRIRKPRLHINFFKKLRKHVKLGDISPAVSGQRVARLTFLHPFNIHRHSRTVDPFAIFVLHLLGGLPYCRGLARILGEK